jgi:predicted TPR repeat methyltransferase
MELRTTDDVLDLLDASVAAAAAGAAIELGLFWILAAGPMPPAVVAQALGIPPRRCTVWLELLAHGGLLVATQDGYGPTAATREAILATYSQETWGLLAQEARERRDALRDVPHMLREPRRSRDRSTYVARMVEDPVRARRFTRMLLELHEPLAASVADALDLRSATNVLDLGGGSGVVAMALARRFAQLRITVVDIHTVCAAGRDIVAERGFADRIAYVAADLLGDDLPPGFDVAIECDVGLYDEGLFRRVRAALVPGGRLLIVDQLAPDERSPRPHLAWAFDGALRDPDFMAPTTSSVRDLLERAGFAVVRTGPLAGQGVRQDQLTTGAVLIEALRDATDDSRAGPAGSPAAPSRVSPHITRSRRRISTT